MPNSSTHFLPQGFRTAGIYCGVKSNQSARDLTVFLSESDCVAAGVFTTNKVCGAPVQISRERVPGENVRAIVINSGNSNACTGEQGLADARTMTARIAEEINCPAESVLVCSTGVIGVPLPV
uniref:bifunctional ornithine acetyltransferase/N-acetylglutamate synthase n=1 Tax=uncultured Rubinisphaera sp. TaxID=1678686 RepID=UPI0030DC0F8D